MGSSTSFLDFRTKLFATCIIAYVMITGNVIEVYPFVAFIIFLTTSFFLISTGEIVAAIKFILLVVTVYLLQKRWNGRVDSFIAVTVYFLFFLILRMGPGFIMARYTFASTTVSDMVCSLKRLKLPDELVIPVIVMARFFYTVKEDYRQIKESMDMNSLTTTRLLLKPGKLLEYRFVPLFICLTKTADEVSVSAMTRGLQPGRRRSSISRTKIGVADWLVLGATFALLALHISVKYKGVLI